ncbi:hypothetical protein [Flavobacterium sp.]|uniref:hypothetical protein n=1 Tax=Flavobacterium sp. TaxID=239 RepID=UPI001B74CD3A|nr:hypothetical protein [Flavobacterium sp.]MBP6183163.1 hypothetical protein [Flavobacterium sp.]
MLIILFISLIIKIEKSTHLTFLLITVFAFYLIGIFLKFMNFNRVQQLKGKLTGNLIFEKDYIQINENKISLENIKKIEITGVDWVGLRNTNYLLSYNYENGVSNGIENYLLIEYNNNTNQKIQFQQNDACEFDEIQEIIKHYYINNKIDYLNCVDILCMSEQNQWKEFKNLNKN